MKRYMFPYKRGNKKVAMIILWLQPNLHWEFGLFRRPNQ
jgi:hypothetical protein